MNIGLIADDSKKKLMQNLCIAYRGILSKHKLYSTGSTGRIIEEGTNLSVHKFMPGHLGGIEQLSAIIEDNQIDLMIYLRNPLSPQIKENSLGLIFKACDHNNIPLATNLVMAEILINALEQGDLDWREMYR